MITDTSGKEIMMSTSSLSHGHTEEEQLNLADRVQLTQNIWLRTSTNRAAAVHLLLNKPTGTFIVRDVIEREDACLMLSVVISSHPRTQMSHLPIYRSPSEEGSRLRLADSQKDFPDLASLVAFYCSKADSDAHLPRLFLPQEILEAKTRHHLLSLAHLGHYFWVPSLFVRSCSLPEEVNAFVSDNKTLDAVQGVRYDRMKDFSSATTRSLCSSPSSESISLASQFMLTDGEQGTANRSWSIGQQSRSHSVDVSGSCCDRLPISGRFRQTTSSDNGSGYVSSSESGSDVVNGMIYYRSHLPDKLSDYEDIWSSHSSSTSTTLPRAFSGSNTPPQAFSSPARLPTPFTADSSPSSPDDIPFSSQHLNLASSGCPIVAERQVLTSERPVGAADMHCTRSSHPRRKVSGTDLMNYQLNRETGARKELPLLEFPQQSEFPKQGSHIASSKSRLQNAKLVQRNAQHLEQQNCNYSVTKMENHRLETMGVFHFDFQQTSRLASHVAKVTRSSPLQYASPDYALPYDALNATMENTAASCNRPHTCQSQSYTFTSRVDNSRRILASGPMLPWSSVVPDCNHGNCNNMPQNLDFRNTSYYRSFPNSTASAVIPKTKCEMRMQDIDLRPTVSDPRPCLREKKSEEIVTMEVGYRLPFDALSFQPNLVSCNPGMNQLLPTHRVSQAVLPLNSVFNSSQAEQRRIEEEHKENKVPRKKSLRASFSAIQKKILRINQKKSRPCKSLGYLEKQEMENVAEHLRCIHYPGGEPHLVGATKTEMSEDGPVGADSSLRRHAFQMVQMRRRRSVYDNVCTPPHHPLLNPCDIPMCGDISPYGDISPHGDVSRPQSRRMTATSRMTTISTATEYCQPWETIRWSQLLAPNSNAPQNSSVQTQCNHLNLIDGQPPFINDVCSETGQAMGRWHQFPEEANGTKGICWNQKLGTFDSGKFLVPSKSTDRINLSKTLHPANDRFSLSLCSNNLPCYLTKENSLPSEHWDRFCNSAQESDSCKAKAITCGAVPKVVNRGAVSKAVTCGAVPFSDSISTEAVRRISKEEMLCCSGNVCGACRNSVAGFHQNREDDDRETLLAPMSPDVIPRSESVLDLSSCRGRSCESTTATRICNYIVNLSQRREGFFGKIIQSFIECTRNATEKNPKNVVRNVRQFMTGLKNYLIHHGEDDLNVFIESESSKMKSSEFLNLDVILERALDDCIIQPLHEHIYRLFVHEYTCDGQLQLMSDGIKFARTKTSFAELGLQPESLCERTIEDALQFLMMMENSHSPVKKFQFLQSAIWTVISEVERRKNSESRHLVHNTEGLISCLVCILLEKGLVSAQIELDYMQGLMDLTSSVTSEGSYHLGLFSCAVELIKKMKNQLQATNDNDNNNTAGILRDELLSVYVPDEKYNNMICVRIPFQPNTVTRDICDMMAYMRMTNPQDYGLFLVTEGTEIRLLDLQKISEFLLAERVKASTADSLPHLIYKRINAKFIWPKNL